jgi:hypothetical protein
LGEFPDLLRQRQVPTPGGAPEMGPLAYPLTALDCASLTDHEVLCLMYELLRYMPWDVIMMARTQLLLNPRENVPILVSGIDIACAAGATVNVCSFTMDAEFCGFLKHLGFGVVPPASIVNVRWRLLIDRVVHPKVQEFVAPASNLASPYEVPIEIPRARTITLQARNDGGAQVNIWGLMIGHAEYVSGKPYGATGLGGVA